MACSALVPGLIPTKPVMPHMSASNLVNKGSRECWFLNRAWVSEECVRPARGAALLGFLVQEVVHAGFDAGYIGIKVSALADFLVRRYRALFGR